MYKTGCCGTVTLYSDNSLLVLDLGTVNHHLCASVSLECNISLVFKYLRMCLLAFAKPLETAGGNVKQYNSNFPLFCVVHLLAVNFF